MLDSHPPFLAARGLGSAHLQTILGSQLPRKIRSLVATQESLPVQVDSDTKVRIELNRAVHADAPVLVLVHGLGGDAHRSYITGTAAKAQQRGLNVVRMNMRNAGRTEAWSKTLYHAGLTDDLEATTEWVQDNFPNSPIILTGFSLGGSVTLNTLAKWGEDIPDSVVGTVVVSVPFDLHECDRTLHRGGINSIYVRYFMRSFRSMWKNKHRAFPDEFPADGLRKVKNVRQFDDTWTAPSFGFDTASNYYDQVSALNLLPKISLPGVVIHADDDPFVPLTTDARTALESHPSLHLLRSAHGGHVGFLGRRPERTQDGWQDLDRWWAENRIVQAALQLAAQ